MLSLYSQLQTVDVTFCTLSHFGPIFHFYAKTFVDKSVWTVLPIATAAV